MSLENIQIVLIGTLKSGNIGSVARAMNTMGCQCLVLVKPQCIIDEQSYWMATHAKNILDNVIIVDSLRDAVAGSAYIVGTTARSRRWRDCSTPAKMSQEIKQRNDSRPVSLIFGPEDSGLSNDELELCDKVVTIPTAEAAASLNISHAVMILCYELFLAAETCAEQHVLVSPASSAKIEAMYDHMRTVLHEIGFLNPQNPEHFLGKFRRIFSRAGLSEDDVQLIRGVFRKLLWYIRNN